MKKRFKKADIAAIDARANDTKKITNEKPLKINMSMDELAKKLMNVPEIKNN